jgi:hypothetical protein
MKATTPKSLRKHTTAGTNKPRLLKKRGTIATTLESKTVRPNSKIANVVEMMRKPGGVTLKAIMDATDWQAHSVRGAISGAIKKKLGLKVVSEMRGEERTYRIEG